MRHRKSKKPSAGNEEPPEPVFFIDRGLGRVDVATALRALGYRVELHDDYFPQTAKDQ